MRCLGTDDYCCTESDPCKEGEGDCDSDHDCEGSLVCGSDNCKSQWHGSMDFDSSDDCCKAQDLWSEWNDASDCQLIGTEWKKYQNRTCHSETCSGLPESKWQLIECDSINGAWSSWSEFGDCQQTKLAGNQLWYQTRTRTCDNPEPKYGGFTCDGSPDDSSQCEPIDGSWTEWIITEGDCSLDSNGDWTKFKSRICNEPKYGGLDCQTDSETGEAENGSYVCPPGDDFVFLDWYFQSNFIF